MLYRATGVIFFAIVLTILTAHGQPETSPASAYHQLTQVVPLQEFQERLQQETSALSNAREANDLIQQAHLAKSIAFLHLSHSGDLETALDFLIQSLIIEDSLSRTREQIVTYIGIADVFKEAGNFLKAREYLEEATELNRKFDDLQSLVLLLNKTGEIKSMLNQREEALDDYKLVLDYADEIGDEAARADALFNMANLYVIQGKFEEALQRHKESLSIRRSRQDQVREAASLTEIAKVYKLLNNPEKALANHVVALDVRQRLKNKALIAESYNHIAALYLEQGNVERAAANLVIALETGREAQAQDQVLIAHDLLSQCYRQAGDFRKALEHRDEYALLTDFIQRDRNERQLIEAQSRYVIDRKEDEIERLDAIRKSRELEIANQKKFRNFLVALVALSVIIAVLILVLYLVKQRSTRLLRATNEKIKQQNLQLVDLNATKDKFFSIISHDLKGPLNSLTSFSTLLIHHTDSLTKEEIQMLAKDLDKSLKNLFALLENLLEWSRSQTGNIEFKAEPFDIAAVLERNRDLLGQQAQTKNIRIVVEGDGPLSVAAHQNSINTVARNLISNAIKFTPAGGTITLKAVRGNQGEAIVSISDTGVGMTQEVLQKLFRIDTKHTTKGTADEKGTGLGLILCKEFVEKNGGRIWVESKEGKGSTFFYTVPLHGIVSPVGATKARAL